MTGLRDLIPDTFLLTLPNGVRVRCWSRDARAIQRDISMAGNVFLRRSERDPEVFERVAPDSVEAADVRARGLNIG